MPTDYEKLLHACQIDDEVHEIARRMGDVPKGSREYQKLEDQAVEKKVEVIELAIEAQPEVAQDYHKHGTRAGEAMLDMDQAKFDVAKKGMRAASDQATEKLEGFCHPPMV